MDIAKIFDEIYNAKKHSLSEEQVIVLLDAIYASIVRGDISTDVQIRLLNKLADKCAKNNQYLYLRRITSNVQNVAVVNALAAHANKTRDISTSVPIRSNTVPIPIPQSRSIGTVVKPSTLKRKLFAPVPSDASNSDHESNAVHDDLEDVSRDLTDAIQKFVNLSVKRALEKKQ